MICAGTREYAVFRSFFAQRDERRPGRRRRRARTPDTATVRPSIGLALGGGAARGFAHIGVMRTLIAHGIVPDVIAGTSIGAVVGGCYAAGKLDEFEALGAQPHARAACSAISTSAFSGSGPDQRQPSRREPLERDLAT